MQSVFSKLKQNFNAKNKWPKCKQNIENVLNQGACGSCYVSFFKYIKKEINILIKKFLV